MTPPKFVLLGRVEENVLVVRREEIYEVCLNHIGWGLPLLPDGSTYPDSLAVRMCLDTKRDSEDFYDAPTPESVVDFGWIPFGMRALRETGLTHLGRYTHEIKKLEKIREEQRAKQSPMRDKVVGLKSRDSKSSTRKRSKLTFEETQDIHRLIQEGERIYSDEGDDGHGDERTWTGQSRISGKHSGELAEPEQSDAQAIRLLNRLWCLNGVFAATPDCPLPNTKADLEELCLHVEEAFYLKDKRVRELQRRVERLRTFFAVDCKKASRYVSDETKAIVIERDGGVCQECGSTENLHFDHDYLHSLGGSNDVVNIRILCSSCNQKRGNLLRKNK